MSSQPHPEPSFQKLLLLIGRLNYTWTNTESLLIHLIAGLAGVTLEVATVIFLSLNTTRARLDLVERLVKLGGAQAACRADVLKATTAMSKALKWRNKYNHCIYSFDADGKNAKAILMRIQDKKNEINFGKSSPLNNLEVGKIEETIADIEAVNKDLWRIFFKYKYPVA